MSEKNYLGSGWLKSFHNGGTIINLSINLEKLKALPVDNYGNVKVIVGQLKSVNQKSKATHCVYEDMYKRDQQQAPTQTATYQAQSNNDLPEIDVDSLNVQMPF